MPRTSAAERRSALVQAALRVIARDGVAAATTRAIVAEAGMSLASFHYAFRSRDELIAKLIQFVVQDEAVAAYASMTPGLDLPSAIRAGLRAFLGAVAGDPSREQAMLELVQYALRTPGLQDAARLQYASYYRAAIAVLTTVAEQTGHTWTRPIDEMARILITITDGLTMAWLVDRDTAAADRVIDFAAQALAALAAPAAGSLSAAGQPPAAGSPPKESTQ
jgi:AcrR family transcriptional regulator